MIKYFSVFVLFLSFLTACNAQSENYKQVDSKTFSSQVVGKKVQLIDVRTPEEYKAGKIANAVNINFFDADFKQQLGKLNKAETVYVYCQSGGRSAKTANMLVGMGFKKVVELKGGYGSYRP